jgi:protein kinase C substrate 80K-H
MRRRSRLGADVSLLSKALLLLCWCSCLVWAARASAAGRLNTRGIEPDSAAALEREIAANKGLRCDSGIGPILPETAWNDDYCDCPNGADEPGTAACAGVASDSRKFYCQNEGFDSVSIPLSWVNDGHCDCCDGSDEWLSATRCENVCHRQQARRRQELEVLLDRCRRGLVKRTELVKKATAIRQAQDNTSLAALRRRLAKSEQAVALLERQRKRLDAWQRWFYSLHEKSSADAPLPTSRTLSVNGSTASESEQMLNEEVTKEFAAIPGDEDPIASSPSKTSWWQSLQKVLPKIRKRLPVDASIADPDSLNSSLCSRVMLSRPFAWALEWAERLDQRLGPRLGQVCLALRRFALLYSAGDPQTQRHHAQICKQLAQEEWLKARQERDAATRALDEAQRLSDTYLGPDNVMLAMQNEPCLRKVVGQYEYEVCLLQHVNQYERGVAGHGGVHLGSFAYVDYVGPNTSCPSDKLVVHFLNGQRCWNGPDRQAIVTLECDEEFELVSVEETERCFYRITMRGPAACSEDSALELSRLLESLAHDRDHRATATVVTPAPFRAERKDAGPLTCVASLTR